MTPQEQQEIKAYYKSIQITPEEYRQTLQNKAHRCVFVTVRRGTLLDHVCACGLKEVENVSK